MVYKCNRITDYLGNVRAVVRDDGAVVEENDYYPYGLLYPDKPNATGIGTRIQPYTTTGKELDTHYSLNWLNFGSRQYMPDLGQWNRVDDLCEEYYPTGPYVYCGANPVKYIDPTGMYINIFYTDALGQQQSFRYERGMRSPVDDTFVNMAITSLNTLYDIEFAMPVMNALINSEYNYDIVNHSSDGGLNSSQFSYSHNPSRYGTGGGEVRIPILLDKELNIGSYSGSLGHELFHGFQRESGLNPESINAEVDAYLFKRMISGTDLGREDTDYGKIYNHVMKEMGNGIDININSFQEAVRTFKDGSIANINGVYNHLKVDNSYKSLMLPLLIQYYNYGGLYQ